MILNLWADLNAFKYWYNLRCTLKVWHIHWKYTKPSTTKHPLFGNFCNSPKRKRKMNSWSNNLIIYSPFSLSTPTYSVEQLIFPSSLYRLVSLSSITFALLGGCFSVYLIDWSAQMETYTFLYNSSILIAKPSLTIYSHVPLFLDHLRVPSSSFGAQVDFEPLSRFECLQILI